MTDLVPTVFPVETGRAATREGMQGQTFAPVLDGRPTGNAPGSPLCQLRIEMRLGKVSTPHVHRSTHVYVHLLECGPQGVLTLWGDELEREEWLFAGQLLWLPPTVPHVAVYPRFHDAPTAVALETRQTPDPTHDVIPLPDLWGTLTERLDELHLLTHVDVPSSTRVELA
jgi:uncharacterized RmlC-like cupin family protein